MASCSCLHDPHTNTDEKTILHIASSYSQSQTLRVASLKALWIVVVAAPFVRKFESKSKNLVQGDPLRIDCKVYSEPAPTITWLRDEADIDLSGNAPLAPSQVRRRDLRSRQQVQTLSRRIGQQRALQQDNRTRSLNSVFCYTRAYIHTCIAGADR